MEAGAYERKYGSKTYTRFFMPSNSFHRKVIVYWKLIAFSDPAVSAI